ncbi:hypothetical protein [Arthrobacter sp. 2MCAF14]|uniref:hypothetical protein n=1 Tax=Arthrobacter sp. 2MCAF14 TaxID=3232982 RepID=UPI003F939773
MTRDSLPAWTRRADGRYGVGTRMLAHGILAHIPAVIDPDAALLLSPSARHLLQRPDAQLLQRGCNA